MNNPWDCAPSDWRYLSKDNCYEWSKTMPDWYIEENPELARVNTYYAEEDKAVEEVEKTKWNKYITND